MEQTLKQNRMRKCPCCKKRVIQPLDFKKFKAYTCPSCQSQITTAWIWTLCPLLSLLLIQEIFYRLDYVLIGHMVLLMLFLYWCFSTKIDALVFPLVEVQN